MPDPEINFRFAPELFERRSEALDFLADHGIVWLTDFNSMDVVHDLYGLEIEGISDKETAKKIMSLLDKRFSGVAHVKRQEAWTYRRMFQERNGWVVEINKYPHPILETQ